MNFFNLLLEETERLLREAGEEIELVDRGDWGYLRSTYSLHGLRAAGITHFVESGVPIQVIAEFLAGHASLFMTLHYVKFGVSYVTDILDRAVEAQDKGANDAFIESLKNKSVDDLGLLVASGSMAGINALADTSPGTWAIGLDGICPVGRTMCNEGGERLSAHRSPFYSPVPGGPRNCPRCRFFITGPAFLFGQATNFNTAVFALGERAKVLQGLKRAAESDPSKISRRKAIRQQDAVDALEIEIEELVRSLQARSHFIEKSRLLLQCAGGNDKLALISNCDQDDVSIVLKHTTDFELISFVSRACEVFPEKAEPAAPLRLGKILDQLQIRNGYRPLFCTLSDEESLKAANATVSFLRKMLSQEQLQAAVEGRATLHDLGIDQQYFAGLKKIVKRPIAPLSFGPSGIVRGEK